MHRAKRAISLSFATTGFAFASWASRIPALRDSLGLDPGQLGLLLLSLAAGSLIAIPLAGATVARFGARRVVVVAALGLALALAGMAVGHRVGPFLVAAALALSGAAVGMWDVSINIQGTTVQRYLGRELLPRLHAGFSAGTVVGAGVGAAAIALGVPVTAHLLAVAVLVAMIGPLTTHWFTDPAPVPRPSADDVGTAPQGSTAREAWRHPRTILLGFFVFGMAFSEGAGDDWLTVAIVDGYGTSAALAAVTFAVFLSALTAGRWFGPSYVDRYGRVALMRVSAGVAIAGVILVTAGAWYPLALVGCALWGLGTALGFPIGISAAADDPVHAAHRVAVVSAIGYCAFLAGPPLIGLLGDRVGTLRSLVAVIAVVGLAAATSGATRREDPEQRGPAV